MTRGAGWKLGVGLVIAGLFIGARPGLGYSASGAETAAPVSPIAHTVAGQTPSKLEAGKREARKDEPPRLRSARRFLARRGPGASAAHTGPLPAAQLAITGGAWTPAGPLGINSISYGLIKGRVSALALDPSDTAGNTLFVGTTGGGLWKSQNAASSTTGSVSFSPVTDGLAALAGAKAAAVSIGAVAVQPGGTGVVLAGLGDPNDALDSYYGAGLLRSADGGQTWSLITQTSDVESGLAYQDFSFIGEGFAGFAWSTANVQLVVAAVSQAYEGTLVNAQQTGQSYEGLYYSTDSGATWHLATIADQNGEDVQGPLDSFVQPDGNAATSVVWNPVRKIFVAAVRYHGYYQSSDGIRWTRLSDYPNGQPGPGLTVANCPTEYGGLGVEGCPIFRGSLAVNPLTGDTFAWTVDAFNQDQGIWQDKCVLSGSACTSATPLFGTQWNTSALEISDTNGPATIPNGDYNLTLAAVPGSVYANADTLLFAGADDLWKCSLANSCAWRNTTNAASCMSVKVAPYQHALAWDAANPLLLYLGNDGGLWRSTDQVGETGSVCSASDATHVQNLNASLGSLAEVESLAQSSATAATMLVGLGANGSAGVVNEGATPGNWNEVLGGEGGPVAISAASGTSSWYVNNAAGVAIFKCGSTSLCTPALFGSTPAIGEAQVEQDGLSMPYPAEFRLDAVDTTQLLIGTCRVWRGAASGAGWSAANAISPILDGLGAGSCNGNALIRSIASRQITTGAQTGDEVIYVGMAGDGDGGATVPGHVFAATITSSGALLGSGWTDVSASPVANSVTGFNPLGADVNGLYVDSHDTTGQTVYATTATFTSLTQQAKQVYRSTDGGAHWTLISSNLPNAPVNAIVVDSQDANTVYVGTDVGVFLTRSVSTCSASNPCWTAYGTGLPLAPVTQLTATPLGASGPDSGQALSAGTYGRGVWQIPLVTSGTTLTTGTVGPLSLTFANQAIGTTSTAQTVTLKNTGAGTLTETSSALVGAAAADYSVADACAGVALATNATCTLKVTFAPTAAGTRTAQLQVAANVPGGQLATTLTGTGVAAGSMVLQPSSLTFATQQVSTTSAAQTIDIQNTGGASVTGISLAATAPFVQKSSTCGTTLAAGAGCAVSIAFAPTAVGAATGTYTVKDSAGTQVAQLSGTGAAAPTDTLSTTYLSFPGTVTGTTSAPLVETITNSGGLPLTGIATSLTSTPPGDFIVASNCGGTLAAGASCAVNVTFAPSTTGSITGTLTIGDAMRAQAVKVAGNGVNPPAITLSPATLKFANQQVNTASTGATVTITNSGGAPLNQPGFSLSGAGATSFQIGATTCGATLANGSRCTVSIAFDPVAAGATTATLTVASSSAGVASQTVALTGTGLAPPMLGVSPAALNLGPVVVGNSSAAFTVQITNTGQIAMSAPAFTVSGPQAADFALSPPTDITACPAAGTTATLAPAAICNIQVTFSPTVAAAENATLTVTASNAVPPTATVSLTGTGTPAITLQASPTQLSFPATGVGTASAAQTLTISNLGRQVANGLTLAATGPYQIATAPTTCKATLSASSFCTVGLSFVPAAAGDQPGKLTVSVSNLGVPPLVIPLDGSGVAVGALTASPTQITFGSVVIKTTSAAQTLTVTNSGQAPVSGMTVKLSTGYTLTGYGCSGTLAAGASCTMGVEFTPIAVGSLAGTLTISSSSSGVTPTEVPLIGNGVPVGSLSLSPTVLSFGSVTAGQTSPPQTVTVTNAGTTTLTGLQFQLAGDYSLPANNCGTQIAAGGTCSFSVAFSPGAAGTRIGSVTISAANTGFTPVVEGLTGTGLPTAQLSVTPAQLSFGSVALGANSVSQTLTISNPGTSQLTGLGITAASPFSVGSGSCGVTLAPSGSCMVPVTFTPTASGSQSGTVTISSSSVGVPAVTVTVTGTGLAPASLQLSPSALTFSGTEIGKTAPGQTVTVTNPGGSSLAGLTVALSGIAAADFNVTSTSCTAALAAGGQCSAVVSFTPSVAGGRQAFLTAASTTSGVTSVNTTLNGTGLTAATLRVAPTTLTFAATLVGQTAATQTLTVTNGGQSGITDLQLGVTAGFALDATRTTCAATLAAGASCTAGVAFDPTTPGTITGSLAVTSATGGAAGAAISATVALTGTGALPPGIVTSPSALVLFESTGIGQAAQPVTVTVTNQGTATALTGLTLALDAAGTASGFGLGANTCGSTLAAGASCTASVTFTPSSAGPLGGTLLISSANGTNPVSLTLGGVGFDFRFTIIGPASATIVQGQTGSYTFALTPIGGASGTFSFACGTVPANALCIFNPAQLGGLKANVTGNVTLGISTGLATIAATAASREKQSAILLLCGLFMLPLAFRRKKWTAMLSLALLLIGLAAGVSSCAVSHESGSETHLGGGTPPGSYTVPVTATSAGVTHSFVVTLVVN